MTRRRCRREDQSNGVPPVRDSGSRGFHWHRRIEPHTAGDYGFQLIQATRPTGLSTKKKSKKAISHFCNFCDGTKTSTISCFRNTPQANRLHTGSLIVRPCVCERARVDQKCRLTMQSAFPAHYAHVQMAVVQPFGVQQPVLAMPHNYVLMAYQTIAAPVQSPFATAPAVQPSPAMRPGRATAPDLQS